MLSLFAYNNLNFTYSQSTVSLILWAFYAGIVIASLFSVISKKISSELINKLLLIEATNKESAITLNKLNLKHPKFTLLFLKKDGYLRKTILCANSEEFIKTKEASKIKKAICSFFGIPLEKEVLNIYEALFYIPEENKIHAEVSLSSKKSPSFLLVLITIIIFAAIVLLLNLIMPKLLNMLDSALNSFNWS